MEGYFVDKILIDMEQKEDGTYEQSMGAMLGISEEDTVAHRESVDHTPQEIHNLLVATKEALQENFLKMGAYLKLIHDESLYLELDSDTWQGYLESPEIDLSRSQAFKLIAVYERWILKWGYSPDRIKKTSIEKLYIASSQAKDDNYDEWLCKAETLSRADLKAETPGNKQKYQTVLCPYCGKEFDLKRENIMTIN